MELGDFIRTFRKINELSMQDFADKCGLSKGYVSMLERGHHPQSARPLVPSLDTLRKLASGMGIQIEDLLSSVDENIEIAVNLPSSSPAPALTPKEEALIADYRDASEEIQEAAATMLRNSAEANRKDGTRSIVG